MRKWEGVIILVPVFGLGVVQEVILGDIYLWREACGATSGTQLKAAPCEWPADQSLALLTWLLIPFFLVILNQPCPPSQQCCSNCHTALLLYTAAAAVHAQCWSPATHCMLTCCWLSMSFCNPITSAATTGRFCFYGSLQRSAAVMSVKHIILRERINRDGAWCQMSP